MFLEFQFFQLFTSNCNYLKKYYSPRVENFGLQWKNFPYGKMFVQKKFTFNASYFLQFQFFTIFNFRDQIHIFGKISFHRNSNVNVMEKSHLSPWNFIGRQPIVTIFLFDFDNSITYGFILADISWNTLYMSEGDLDSKFSGTPI